MRYLLRTTLITPAMIGVMSGVMMACGRETVTNPEDPKTIFAKLTLNHKAVILSTHAPYDTVTLRAIPSNIYSDTLPHEQSVRFRPISQIDTTVRVDTAGLIAARARTSGTRVEASLTINGITRTDTVVVMVNDATPVQEIVRLEISPLAPDSSWLWAGGSEPPPYQRWVRLYAADSSLIPMSQAVIAYRWSDPSVIVPPAGMGAKEGTSTIHASVFAYGKLLEDSMVFHRIDPPVRFMAIGRLVPRYGESQHRFFPDSVEIRKGTTVIFLNAFGNRYSMIPGRPVSGFDGDRIIHQTTFSSSVLGWVDSTDIIFDHPEGVSAGVSFGSMKFPNFESDLWPADGGSGNIEAFGLLRCWGRAAGADSGCGGIGIRFLDMGFRSRQFNTPGVYRFHSTRFTGAGGTIVVKD